ncbi:MAG: sulfotransferase family protein [bacterium]
MNIKKRIIAVIGSQRSGTSAITRGLKALGASLGDYYGQEIKAPDNEKGFFEDLEVSALDVAMLNFIGLTWDNPALPIVDENTRKVLSEFFSIAENIMRIRLESADLFGFKDPLIARLLPLWNEAFIKIGADISYIIACRNPLSVARSLQKRDNLDIVKGCYIWFGALVSALIYSEGFNRIAVDYDEVMKDPEKQIRRMAERLNLNFNPESAEFKEYRDDFLSASLRHTSFGIDDLAANADVPPKIAELYGLLKKLAADEIKIDGVEAAVKIKKIYSWAAELRSTLLYMQAQSDALCLLNGALAEKDRKIAELTKAIKEKEKQ